MNRNGKGHKAIPIHARLTAQQASKLQQLAALRGVGISEALRDLVDSFTVDVTWPSSQAQEMKEQQG